ncbi:MAG: hypothetical protein WBM83_04520 [Flavobacteriaceae bacterium]
MEHLEHADPQNWLQRLKNESWEAELLVSAVAIFAILKSFSALDWLLIQFIDRLNPSQYEIGYFILVFGYLAIGILAAMFAIHFAFRAYWIGLVGLNSVFPDYGLEDSAYSPIYTKKILQVLPNIKDSITKIDELCSVIFSAAFAFMLIYSFATISSSLYLILFNMLSDLIPDWVLLAPLGLLAFVLFAGLLVSIPANMKKFHKNETIQHLYFLYARWATVPFYGPFYKSIMQISMLFGSNFKKKKGLVKMVILMLLIGIFFGGSKLIGSNYRYLITSDYKPEKSRLNSSFYSDNNSESNFLLHPEIQTEIISDNAIKLFIPLFNYETNSMIKQCELSKFSFDVIDDTDRQKMWQDKLDCYKSYLNVSLDEKLLTVNFLKTDHPSTAQFGLIGFISLSASTEGLHHLKVSKKISEDFENTWNIPFFYSPK